MSELLDRLTQRISGYCSDGIALGFSGGTDSALLLAVTAQLREKMPFPFVAVMMHSVFQSEQECMEAEALANQFSVPFVRLEYDPLLIPEVKKNSRERCYYCKKFFFSKIQEFAKENSLGYIFDGTNADDLTKYRPGQKAIRELGIRSPLAESNLSKAEVRRISRELNLPTAEKPASPCFATRFEYDMELTAEKIRLVASGEEIIRTLLPEAEEIRLRIEGDSARIEVSAEYIPFLLQNQQSVFEQLNGLGLQKISIDPEGYRSGSFDKFSVS